MSSFTSMKKCSRVEPELACRPRRTRLCLGIHIRLVASQFSKKSSKYNELLQSSTAIMGRLHSKGKGISASAIPYSRQVPTWFKSTPDTVVDNICKLARKGATPSQIGVVLRDSHGVAQVKVVTGNKILRILKSNGMRPSDHTRM